MNDYSFIYQSRHLSVKQKNKVFFHCVKYYLCAFNSGCLLNVKVCVPFINNLFLAFVGLKILNE